MLDSSPGQPRLLLEATLRRAVPGLVLLLALGTLAAGPWALDRLRALDAWSHGERAEETLVCSYRLRTGLPCIGCGGTRAFQMASRGEWRAAFATNVLGASTGASAWLLAAGAAWCALRGRTKTLGAWTGGCAAALLVVLLVQVVMFLRSASAGPAGRGAATVVTGSSVK